MAKRRKVARNTFIGATGSLLGASVILGVGSTVVTRVGGSAGGLTAAASFLPPIGATIGAGFTIGQLRRLQRTKKKK